MRNAADTVISDSTLSYNDRDQLTSRSDPVAGINVTQTWDDNGNLATQTVNSGTPRSYTYDARDRLLSLQMPAQQRGTTTLSFAYHPDGLRREKSDGNTTTRYQYDDQSLLAETNTLGNTLRQYHYSATQLIAETKAGTTPVQRHYLLDALRSPIALLTQEGAVSARTSYDAFGEVRAQVGTTGTLVTPDREAANAGLPRIDDQAVGFTGYIKDSESGLYYARARYYDPATARFTTEDPEAGKDLEPPSLHRYLYAYGNPTYYTDPDGREVWNAQMSRLNQMVYEKDALKLEKIKQEYGQENIRQRARGDTVNKSIVDFISQSATLAATLARAHDEIAYGSQDYSATKALFRAGANLITDTAGKIAHPIDRIYKPINDKFKMAYALDQQGKTYEAETVRHSATLNTLGVVSTAVGLVGTGKSIAASASGYLGKQATKSTVTSSLANASIPNAPDVVGPYSKVAFGIESLKRVTPPESMIKPIVLGPYVVMTELPDGRVLRAETLDTLETVAESYNGRTLQNIKDFSIEKAQPELEKANGIIFLTPNKIENFGRTNQEMTVIQNSEELRRKTTFVVGELPEPVNLRGQ